MSKLYTLKILEKKLKIRRNTLYRYISQGDLKAIKIGKSYRVRESDLQLFLDKCNKATEMESQNRQENTSFTLKDILKLLLLP